MPAATLAVTATTNEHARLINTAHPDRPARGRGTRPHPISDVRDGVEVMVGDVMATRHNQRDLRTDAAAMVRNRDRWTVTRIADDGTLTLSKLGQPGTVIVPRDTARDTIELAYAVTDYGNQGDTYPAAITLISTATTARGLYVAMTRGRNENVALVITDTHDSADARDVLEGILAVERVDVPATVQRRTLAAAGTPAPAPARPGAPVQRVRRRRPSHRRLPHLPRRAATVAGLVGSGRAGCGVRRHGRLARRCRPGSPRRERRSWTS